jgi:predicted transcriptional regulator
MALYHTPPGDLMAFTVRLPTETAAWTSALAQQHDATLSAAIMQVLEDERTLWGLEKDRVKALRADAKALGLSQRDYIYYLLRERVRTLRETRK